jgi:hypothetical protein
VLASEPVKVDIALDLDLSPAATAKRLLVGVGQQVEQGTILAQKGGFGSRASRSPVTGTFSGYDASTGVGQITVPPEPVTLHAHIKGIVTDLVPYYGAVIETPATLIRGIYGVGGEQHGVLKVLVPAEDEPVTTELVDARVTYAIAMGGSDVTADALRRMIELGARGFITGSIRSSELSSFIGSSAQGSRSRVESGDWARGALDFGTGTSGSTVPPDFVLILTEGFGSVPMSPRTFEAIASHDGQEIAIDGTTRRRGGLARPEIIIPLARTASVKWLEESGPKLAVGTNVRLLSPAYLGQAAQVVGLPNGPRAAQSGVVAPVADVQFPGGQRLRVPIVDLEVVE